MPAKKKTDKKTAPKKDKPKNMKNNVKVYCVRKAGAFYKMEESKVLHLHVNYEYFDDIKAGIKTSEYRLDEKWGRKLASNSYSHIRIYRAYQKVSEDTVLDFEYAGYNPIMITHKQFGKDEVLVCEIPLGKKL